MMQHKLKRARQCKWDGWIGEQPESMTTPGRFGRRRWLKARGVEAHLIHLSSVAASREQRRAKTGRLDTELLKRQFLGWLRGENRRSAA